jgi:hypothetical protein
LYIFKYLEAPGEAAVTGLRSTDLDDTKNWQKKKKPEIFCIGDELYDENLRANR